MEIIETQRPSWRPSSRSELWKTRRPCGRFRQFPNRKDAVSYLDDIADDAEAASLLERRGAFSRWAEKTFADLRRRAPAP
jgi:hypothetical protein